MDHNLLVSELQSLVVESKRRNSEVREAGENALELLKGGPLSKETITQHADTLLAPITLGCKTKTGKIIGISIAALQRLVALGGVPTASLPGVLATLNSVAGQAVDIQLKTLQVLLSILTHNSDVHGEVLGNALLLCFKLQDSRVSVVSSTAAATLRQAVMLVFDRISSDTTPASNALSLPTEPPTEITISDFGLDAFNLFSDLCILTAGGSGGGFGLWGGSKEDKPKLLKLSSLQRTFGLELVESVLSGYEEGVKQRPELLFLLSHSLDPLLHKLLLDKPSYPIALRVCRLQFLLIRSFAEQLPAEVEGCLATLIRIGTGESEGDETKKDNVPSWLRVLALEIFRGICGDAAQLRNIWKHFDQPGGPLLFKKIISALGRLLNEKPVLLGIGPQMNGIGVAVPDSNPHGGYLDMGIGMMASAASAGITTVGTMMGSGAGGLGAHSGMKLRLIEQHDKADAPIIPETYIYLLALQSLDAVAEGIYLAAGQTAEPENDIRGMAESAWPALLAGLSYGIGTNLSDSLFAEVLSALQDFTVACGLLNLDTPRNAFLSTMSKYAVPPPAVSAMQTYMDAPSAPRNNSITADSLGLGALTGTHAGPPSLSERNLACLRSMVMTARMLAGSLGEAWHDVLETLQNANFMLGAKKPIAISRRPTAASPQIGSFSSPKMRSSSEFGSTDVRPDIFDDLDTESIQSAINLLFDGLRDLDDQAFTTFIEALCQLNSEMIGAGTVLNTSEMVHNASESPTPSISFSPGDSTRRTSGINISNSIKSGERSFSLNKLRLVASTNLSRLINSDPSMGWDIITKHLLAIARHLTAPSALRLQATDALQELLLGAVRFGKESRTQHQVFDVLVRQVDVLPFSLTVSTDHDVRSSGYQTLNQILESSGHALEVGWGTIFGMLNNVCKDRASEPAAVGQSDSRTSRTSTQPRPSTLSRSDANLVRIAFPSLNLICTDFLSSLDTESIRQCISCLGFFGRQREDVNITLAAIGLLWNVSDAVQGSDKKMWLYLLSELLELGRDQRLEVRSSAMQTLFRCIDLYGSGLSSEMWEEIFWKIISPLLEASAGSLAPTGDESTVLALTSVGSIFQSFLPALAKLESFERIWAMLCSRVEVSWEREDKKCRLAALRALERAFERVSEVPNQSPMMLESTWTSFLQLAEMLKGNVYTQDNLIGLVRIAQLLHDKLEIGSDEARSLSGVLRGIMTYDKSPEYRPDNDNMSPLQESLSNLLGHSTKLGAEVVLSDLAEWTSLAYVASTGKTTYVGLSKWGMGKMKAVFDARGSNGDLYTNGTVESVLGAYALPIKLKYDCPPANRFGDDPPLWRSALGAFVPVVERVTATLSLIQIPSERSEGIWALIIDVFAAILVADSTPDTADVDEPFVLTLLKRFHESISPGIGSIPDRLVDVYTETLRKASTLYHFDVSHIGGTTAPAIAERSEEARYWAFETLLTQARSSGAQSGRSRGKPEQEGHGNVAQKAAESLVRRMDGTLRDFIDDARLRGQVPLGRVREEELLFILRHLATIRIHPNTLTSPNGGPMASAIKTSERALLFRFYPLLLEVAFLQDHVPSMWIFPNEHARLYDLQLPDAQTNETTAEKSGEEGGRDRVEGMINAGDGGDLIEVTARDLARRCLEIVGEEMGLGA